MDVTLVRHPEADVPPGTCYGRLDPPLSAAGAEHAARLVQELTVARPHLVLTSPAQRCRSLSIALHPNPVVDGRLRELDFGAWEGRRWTDIPCAEIECWGADLLERAPPGGETGRALLDRVGAVARELAATVVPTIVVLHGGPMKVLLGLLAGVAPELAAPAPPPGTVLRFSRR